MIEDMDATVAHLEKMAGEWRTTVTDLQERLIQAQGILSAVETVLELCQDTAQSTAHYGVHDHIRPSDLAACPSQLEAAIAIAKRTGGVLQVAPAARLIYAAGLSNAKSANNVKASLHGQLDRSDVWEHEGEGTGRYRLVSDSIEKMLAPPAVALDVDQVIVTGYEQKAIAL